MNLVLRALNLALEVASSLPQLKGMYSRTEPDVEKDVFSRRIAIWNSVNVSIQNLKPPIVSNSNWVIRPEASDMMSSAGFDLIRIMTGLWV